MGNSLFIFPLVDQRFLYHYQCIHALPEKWVYHSFLSNIQSTLSQWSITSDISPSNTIRSTFLKIKPGPLSPKDPRSNLLHTACLQLSVRFTFEQHFLTKDTTIFMHETLNTLLRDYGTRACLLLHHHLSTRMQPLTFWRRTFFFKF